MKTLNKGRYRVHMGIWIASLFALVATACSDGAAPVLPEPSDNAPAIALTAQSGAEEPVTCTAQSNENCSIAVQSGDSAIVSWDVSLADKVELSVAGAAKEEVKAKDSRTIDKVEREMIFVLTATKKASDEKKPDLISTARVSVTIASAPPEPSIELTATPATIQLGDSTQLCWKASPKGSIVEVKDAAGNVLAPESAVEPVVEEVVEEGAVDEGAADVMAKLSLSLPVADPMLEEETVVEEPMVEVPALVASEFDTGCTVAVNPPQTTTYMASILDAEGKTLAAAEATVIVEVEVSVELRVNDKNAVTVKNGETVRLSWKVQPESASLSLDPAACDVAAATEGGLGSCDVATGDDAGVTTYTITATEGDVSVTASVTVTVEKVKIESLVLSASKTDVFAGESVTFSVSGVDDGMGVSLTRPDGTTVSMAGGSAIVVISQAGAYQAEAESVVSNALSISVRHWDEAFGADADWSSVSIHPAGHVVLAGTDAKIKGVGEEEKTQVVYLGKHTDTNAWQSVEVKYGALMGKMASDKGTFQETALATYGSNFPVHAFAYDLKKDDGKRVYAAMAGALLFSSDGGATWDIAAPFPILDPDGSDGSIAKHVGCDGREQIGLNADQSKYSFAGSPTFVNLQQVCDVIVDYEGEGAERVIVATDHGVDFVDDIDAYRAGRNKGGPAWMGNYWNNDKDSLVIEKNIFSMTVNDIELIRNGEAAILFAATNHGVYVNSQRGAVNSWEDFNGGEMGAYDRTSYSGEAEAIYSLVIDTQSGTAIAGTKSGKVMVRSTDLLTGQWSTVKTFAASVYSLAFDAASGVLVAGTGNGVHISRDGGQSWIDVSASMSVAAAPAATAVEVASEMVKADDAAASDDADADEDGDAAAEAAAAPADGAVVVYSVTVSTHDGQTTYAIATNRGVFISHAQGSVAVPAPMPEDDVIIDEPAVDDIVPSDEG